MRLKIRLWFGGAVGLLLVMGLVRCGSDVPAPTEVDESGQLGLAATAGTPSGKITSAAPPIRTTGIGPGPAVAVLAYCTDLTGSFGADTAENVLVADGRFGSVTLIDGDVLQPTGAELAASYQCAVAMSDNRCGGLAPGSDQLDEFVGLGGGLVLSTFGFATEIGFENDIFAAGLSPFQKVSDDNGVAGPVDVAGASTTPPCDELMAGVTAFNSTFSSFVDVSAGATLCASYVAGEEFLAVNADQNIVGLNLFPATAANAAQSGWALALSNAAAFVCGAAPPLDGPGSCLGQATSPGVTSFTFNGVTTFIGTDGSDIIGGTDHIDIVIAKGGDDTICTWQGPDVPDGGPDDDLIFGGTQNDRMFGKEGHDHLFGEAGQDRLDGGHTPVPSSNLDTQPDICEGGLHADRYFLCETIIDAPDPPKQ